jgi:hypothetical protein
VRNNLWKNWAFEGSPRAGRCKWSILGGWVVAMATLSGTHQITPSSRRSDVIIMAQPLPYGIRCWGAKTNGIIWTNKGNVITRCAFWKAERFDAEHNNAGGGKFTRSGISRENRAGRYLKINSRRRAKINPIVYRTVFTIGTPKYIFFWRNRWKLDQ